MRTTHAIVMADAECIGAFLAHPEEQEEEVVMKGIRFLLAGALLLASAAGAQTPTAELGPVGDDAPDYLWCMRAQHKILLNHPIRTVYRGRTQLPNGEAGRIHITAQTAQHFAWPEILEPDPDHSPKVIYPAATGELDWGRERGLLAKPGTLPGLYYVQFVAVDSAQRTNPVAQGCLVEVASHLPDVEVAGLTLDAQPTGTLGRLVRMTVRNPMPATAQSLLSVPWSISFLPGGPGPASESILAQGVHNNVAPGSTFEVTAALPWRRQSSIRDIIIGRVDPQNVIGENEAERTNNQKTIGATPAASSPTPPPPVLVTQELDYSKAHLNGAVFKHNKRSSGCTRLGVGDWLDPGWSPRQGRKPGVLFQANCLAGGAADPEAYANFRLKNGWVVRSVEPPETVRQSTARGRFGTTNFEMRVTPVVGSDNPYMRAHIGGGRGSYRSVGVRVIIEGPEGTDPYRAGPCPNDCVLDNSVCLKPAGDRNYACVTHNDCADGYNCGSDSFCRKICRD